MLNRARIFAIALVWLAGPAHAFAESATLFRVYLNDGSAVTSYGEYARVGDRLVFSMPIGGVDSGASSQPTLHIVNLPISSINWTATERYAESARYSRYIETRAESDYAALAGEVAATLNAVALAKDPKAQLNLAVAARRRLASWPRDHFGYRADDVREMLGLLDEAISGLRIALGETSFAIDLVANAPATRAPDATAPLRAPTASEAIVQAVAVAKASDVAADRVSILRTVVAELDSRGSAVPSDLKTTTRRWALHVIKEETRIDRQYSELAATSLKRAADAAIRADVRGVQRVLASLERRDAELGRRRPDELYALIDQVRGQLDAARRLRLARDRWRERSGTFRAYRSAVDPLVATLARARQTMDDIKALAGSDPAELIGLADKLQTASKTLSAVSVPDELKPAHALLSSAVNLAETAVKTRRQAATSGELSLAWDASSAAAGSMMLLEKAREDMEAATRLPEIR